MTIIGITGPTGAGKTTALDALSKLGAEIIDCDAVYHELLDKSQPLLDELRSRYGDGIFTPEGRLERKALGAIVFDDPAALSDLNGITHRYVGEEVERRLTRARAEGRPAAAVDAIALLESGIGRNCHYTVAVTAPDEVRIARIMARDNIGEDYARARVSAQRGAQYYRDNCDYTLYNDGERSAFQKKARILFEQLISQGGTTNE